MQFNWKRGGGHPDQAIIWVSDAKGNHKKWTQLNKKTIIYINNSVALVREWTTPNEQSELDGEDIINLCR
jgi:hypothetical protein